MDKRLSEQDEKDLIEHVRKLLEAGFKAPIIVMGKDSDSDSICNSKGVLVFDLPEDSCAHKIAVHAMDWALSVEDLERWLRDQVRYHNREELQEVRDMLRDILGGRGIDTDDIE